MCSVLYVQELCVGIMENAVPYWKHCLFAALLLGLQFCLGSVI